MDVGLPKAVIANIYNACKSNLRGSTALEFWEKRDKKKTGFTNSAFIKIARSELKLSPADASDADLGRFKQLCLLDPHRKQLPPQQTATAGAPAGAGAASDCASSLGSASLSPASLNPAQQQQPSTNLMPSDIAALVTKGPMGWARSVTRSLIVSLEMESKAVFDPYAHLEAERMANAEALVVLERELGAKYTPLGLSDLEDQKARWRGESAAKKFRWKAATKAAAHRGDRTGAKKALAHFGLPASAELGRVDGLALSDMAAFAHRRRLQRMAEVPPSPLRLQRDFSTHKILYGANARGGGDDESSVEVE